MGAPVIVTVPIPLPSLANMRGHWSKKAGVVKRTRGAVTMYLGGGPRPALPCVVTITRVAPFQLDKDNAVSSMKGVQDAVAQWLGIDDRDPRVDWRYAQEKGKPPRVVIEVATLTNS